jgi:deazaflavin-dependent oxidoreductase (nitroreductase family)
VDPNPLDAEAVCHLTTTGRSTGRPRGIEIWFTALGDSLYLISGGGVGADWVQNLLAHPAATVQVGDQTIPVIGRAPVHTGEERTVAVDRLFDKYGEQVTGTREDWHRAAFLVALDIRPHTR